MRPDDLKPDVHYSHDSTDPCEQCGSKRVDDNGACGDPECCGTLAFYCLDCGRNREP